jgi:hypothetical protein
VRWDGFDICGSGTSRAGKWEAQVGIFGDVDPVAAVRLMVEASMVHTYCRVVE